MPSCSRITFISPIHSSRALSVMISRILFWDSFSATALNALKASGASDLVVCTPHERSRLRRCTCIPFRQPISPALARRCRCVLDPGIYSSARLRPYAGSVPMQRTHILSGRSVITIPFAPLSANATTVLKDGSTVSLLCRRLFLPGPPSHPCRDVQLTRLESVPRHHRPLCMQLLQSTLSPTR